MRVHNPSAVRRVIFSPCVWNPLFVLVGMDNGTLHRYVSPHFLSVYHSSHLTLRWDLKMGQRGLLDRLPVAHTAPITTIDWASGRAEESSTAHAISFSGHHQVPEHYTGNTLGWVASAGLDRCIKVQFSFFLHITWSSLFIHSSRFGISLVLKRPPACLTSQPTLCALHTPFVVFSGAQALNVN